MKTVRLDLLAMSGCTRVQKQCVGQAAANCGSNTGRVVSCDVMWAEGFGVRSWAVR